jgi:hypothetical protein
MVNENPRLNKGLAREGTIGHELLEVWLSAVPYSDTEQQKASADESADA